MPDAMVWASSQRVVLGAVIEGANHRRAARRLHRDMRGRLLPMNRWARVQRTPSTADQTGAAAGRIEDHVGASQPSCSASSPIVFLPSIRYGSFKRGSIEPAGFPPCLADDLAAIVDQPLTR